LNGDTDNEFSFPLLSDLTAGFMNKECQPISEAYGDIGLKLRTETAERTTTTKFCLKAKEFF